MDIIQVLFEISCIKSIHFFNESPGRLSELLGHRDRLNIFGIKRKKVAALSKWMIKK